MGISQPTYLTRTDDLVTHIGAYVDQEVTAHEPGGHGFPVEPPSFVRVQDSPIFTQPGQSSPSLYWPWLIRVDTILPGIPASQAWRMYYSTDHAGTNPGGVYYATAPAPPGPWTPQGLCFQDTVQGTETETPAVLWNPAGSLFHLYYSQKTPPGGGADATLYATSADGITWTRSGNRTFYISGSWPGDGHTGYAIPWRIGNRWFSYHLAGGGDEYGLALSHSRDGLRWLTDPTVLRASPDMLGGDSTTTAAAYGYPVQWRHQLWLIFIRSQFVSGTSTSDSTIQIAPLSPDFRRVTGPPTQIWAATETWEDSDVRAINVVAHNGELYLTYQMDPGTASLDRFAQLTTAGT